MIVTVELADRLLYIIGISTQMDLDLTRQTEKGRDG